MARVRLPDGCTGIDVPTATGVKKYSGKPGSMIEVEREHAAAINGSWYKQSGVMSGNELTVLGTKKTRICTSCQPNRYWQAWSIECPRCGAETVEE